MDRTEKDPQAENAPPAEDPTARDGEGQPPSDPPAEAEGWRGSLDSEESSRPFRLVKYFSVTGFLLILLTTLGLTLIISSQTRGLIQQKSEDYARLLAENLNHQVFLQFVVPIANTYGRIRLSDSFQYGLLDAVVSSTIHGFDVEKVKLFDLEGNIIYCTDRSLVGSEIKDIAPYMNARDGEKNSLLITTPGEGLPIFHNTYTLRTFFPFRAEKALKGAVGNVLGVFEIHQDLTADYRDVTRFQGLMLIITLVFTGILFIILRMILARGERIIEKRNDEQRRLEEKLHHSERLASLGQMIAAVAHEIRNPLGIISSTAEILTQKVKKYEPNNHLAEVIVEESRRLNGIVTEFLDFARPQEPKPTPCLIESIIEENLEFLNLDLEKHGIEVLRSYREPETVSVDSDMLYRAFLNIFLNAIQAMPDGGVIEITTRTPPGENGRPSGQIEIIVADNGPGIDPEKKEKLFNPFFTTKNRGSGLGLAIVRNIIEAHRGTVDIESGEDKGARVIVRIPGGIG